MRSHLWTIALPLMICAVGGIGNELAGATLQSEPNELTDEERGEGWVSLFDGAILDKWRGFGQDDVPVGWRAENGMLAFLPGEAGGDLITREQYGNFELKLQWKISEGGNSGIFFHVTEDADRTWKTGPEMQVLDNENHRDGQNPLTSAGSNYGLDAPSADATRPVGTWNDVHIIVRGPRVEQWLNGQLVVAYELWSDAWSAKVAAMKFAETPGYGMSRRGHLGLQDHGDRVWYRNLRVRPLP